MALTMTTPDEIFDALSSRRRRAAIALLDEHRDGGVELRTIADEIGAHEVREDAPEGELKNAQQAVYVSLYQSHLPKLEDAGVVETEQHGVGQGGHVVEPGDEFERALRTLRAAEGEREGTITDRLRDLL